MSVTSVYRHIIDDVVRGIRAEFAVEGVEDSIIIELQHMWESRLMQSGAIVPVTEDPPATTASNSNSSSNSGSSSNTTTPTTSTTTTTTNITNTQQLSAPRIIQTTSATNNNTNNTNITTPEQVRSSLNTLRQINASPQSFGRPSQYMPPIKDMLSATLASINSPQQQQLQQQQNITNNANTGSLKSLINNIPQNDGSFESKEEIDSFLVNRIIENQQNNTAECTFNFNIPQADGGGDELDDMEEHKPDSAPEQDLLNSDLDDDEDSDPDPIIEHFILCQYDKVTRIKNKRKCSLKDGIMHLNGRDTLFQKAMGEIIWR